MKKGYTIIELIISISLILLIGTGVAFFTISKSNKDELEQITKQIIEAANLFIKTEIDKNGKNYLEQLSTGAKGVKVPITQLLQKGYIEESTQNKLYKLKNVTKPSNKSYYVMFVEDTANYCDEGSYVTKVSWMDENEPIYLCNKYDEPDNPPIDVINSTTKLKVSLNKFAVSEEFYNASSYKSMLTYKENGIFTYYSENSNTIYNYYRGAVDNNYLKLGEKDGHPLIWRILWYNDKKRMKLVLDEPISINITTLNNNHYTFNDLDDELYAFEYDGNGYIPSNWKNKKNYYTFNPTISDDWLIYTIDTNILFESNLAELDWKIYNNNNPYMKWSKEWYDSTNLKDFEINSEGVELITNTNNFCYNSCGKSTSTQEVFYPSDNFECIEEWDEDISSASDCDYSDDQFYSSPVGFLTYGEAIRAGLAKSGSVSNLQNSGLYLTTTADSIMLSDRQREFAYDGLVVHDNYYYTSSGITDDLIYKGEDETTRITLLDKYSNETLKLAEIQYYDDVYWNKITKNNYDIEHHYFRASALKPVIVIDMSNASLSKSGGTISNPYTIVEN